ncbi:SxtJ family membrane protein [Sinorhizobium numidicum]|uniref:SxtJ family membrane protein n=1 Tax=Sinorhizobium numidicum TaxID=680248 RepID=A0ABY8CWC1_9HYPH|nr:SxtJ family membrane protein [Sinorhizobium numidicum]WEX75596.1 SxtJ family membrane protein [Sinorhizobium numidicum]WEX81593.1 SxtJ family membrane protein [Sinorhizobium numidicum]
MSISHDTTFPEPVKGPSNRNFGYTVGGILLAIAGAKWWMGPTTLVTIALAAIGIALVAMALIAPALLTVPNQLWTRLGTLLSKIANPLVMLFVYVTTFLPIGFILRLRGHDPLAPALDRAASTYWKTRAPNEPNPSTMTNQY